LSVVVGSSSSRRDHLLFGQWDAIDTVLRRRLWPQTAAHHREMTRASDGCGIYERLSRIHDERMQVCRWLNEKRDTATASRLIPITDDLTHLVAEISVKKKLQEMI
jgi:hypothetical protein